MADHLFVLMVYIFINSLYKQFHFSGLLFQYIVNLIILTNKYLHTSVDVVHSTNEKKNEDSIVGTNPKENYQSAMDLIVLANSSKFYLFGVCTILGSYWLSWTHHLKGFTVAMTWLTVTEYLCHKWPRICSICRIHFPVLSSFMIYHRVCN